MSSWITQSEKVTELKNKKKENHVTHLNCMIIALILHKAFHSDTFLLLRLLFTFAWKRMVRG